MYPAAFSVILCPMKNHQKTLSAVLLITTLCMLLSGCPRLWGQTSSGGSSRGGVVVDISF
jgi:starvation-inducible outer membrane lipoprotein